MDQGFGPYAENGFKAFHRVKMSSEDMQHEHIKMHFLPKIKLNCIDKLYAPEYAKSFRQCSHTRRSNEETSTPTVFVSSP